jgi:hypothetical protein
MDVEERSKDASRTDRRVGNTDPNSSPDMFVHLCRCFPVICCSRMDRSLSENFRINSELEEAIESNPWWRKKENIVTNFRLYVPIDLTGLYITEVFVHS